ncbi:similar to Saccharomyces cerevisiae YDL156W Putative protein of unknown function [Maudiozyma barnettii]|uniref:DNA damage-binding protein CMR1 n=1 Tax=Maudiozyma barnettii TaxID=61262 RepID=A0A8H2VBE8_9SACH|nr:Cmr1p [Kazachstania barnettii]CAB4252197.1 similar to Saccharomyces cerevisiae YDL156W Putative protein of unknown function [Kazachstania barnettii]CAD1778813.1 similar to Saccharomyces cerevisiae YDL156W Putative protein of unknown function [Kazachstania barnettii]
MSSDSDNKLTNFQKKRLENIKRNNELLQKLNLSKLSNSIKPKDVKIHERKSNGSKIKSAKRRKLEELKPERLPTRRSRRLQGQTAEPSPELPTSLDNISVKPEVEDVKILGDLKLSDLVKDEEQMSKMANLKVSSGDFFNELRNVQTQSSDVKEEVKIFDKMEMWQDKVIYERISSLFIHPSKEKFVMIAGDISGNVGLWNKDISKELEPEEDEDIFRFQLFSKNVSRIDCFPTKMEKLILASYDGFIRSLDLNNQKSDELLQIKDPYDDFLGVSDCQFSYSDPNVLYLTTLSGEFALCDMREDLKKQSLKLKRLADKKIGSMAINPKNTNQIATGSLDRTMKLWDIRKLVDKPDWSQYEDYPSHDIVATYDSRLSISGVSYSPTDETLVCNGYDDTIRLFDVKESSLTEDLQPKLTMKHNCQTGRWTSILKARFKANKNIFAIANMSRAVDVYTSEGQQLAHMATPTVPAVISWHPTLDTIVGGNSSGKVFLFSEPAIKKEEEV